MNNREGKLGRWGELMILAQRLPLAVPMAGDPEVSSTYGRRLDPFTKQWAFHAGIDFIGPLRSPILSTAPGVVVFAGRKGPYGRTVEIYHGLGIRSEEHTSELQSLMRISYAVFCLTKKIQNKRVQIKQRNSKYDIR